MENTVMLIIPLLIGVTIFFLIHYFSPKATVLRRLKKLPRNRVGSLRTHSFSKISGKALNITMPLMAPYSKRRCVFYKITIKQRVKSGKHTRWKELVNHEEIQDFFIEQHGERVLVIPNKNYIDYVVVDKRTSSGTFNDPTPEFEALLHHYNINSETLFGFNKQLRYEEAIIEVGEYVTVAGHVKWMDLDEPVADYSYSNIATLSANGKNKLIITDTPKAIEKR